MKLYFFSFHPTFSITEAIRQSITNILCTVSENTDTSDLVVCVYISYGKKPNFGTAYVQQWVSPSRFFASRGKWKLSKSCPYPHDLPEKFKLIRLHYNLNQAYPHTEKDIYGWQFHYSDAEAQIAMLFAHELHHYRRHHLGLHPREGEHGANKWALQYIQSFGYAIEGKRTYAKKKKSFRNIFSKLTSHDPFAGFRHYQPGDTIQIYHDPSKRYCNETATVVRKLRGNAKRMIIKTSDGKQWRWPVQWLTHSQNEK